MAQDRTLAIRRAILPALKHSAIVTALVPPERVFSSTTPGLPVFPFVRYGVAVTSPFRASGLDSSAVSVPVHAFTKPLYDASGAMLATAEDRAHLIGAAIAETLDDITLALEGGGKARVTWAGSNIIMDGDEADAWHAIVNLRVEAAG